MWKINLRIHQSINKQNGANSHACDKVKPVSTWAEREQMGAWLKQTFSIRGLGGLSQKMNSELKLEWWDYIKKKKNAGEAREQNGPEHSPCWACSGVARRGPGPEWLVQTHVCGHSKSYGTYSKYFGKPWQGWNVMNKNHATTRHCPAFPWNIPEMEGLGTRALDFQGLRRKNHWRSSPVKPPPAGLPHQSRS